MSEHDDNRRFKVAAVQASPIIGDAPNWFDLKSTTDKAVSLIAEAGNKGARLIVFPECWIPCYPYWALDLNSRLEFAEIWANFLWNSVEVPSRETEVLCAAAKSANAYVAMGINERDKTFPGRMYNSILYLSPRGEIVGTHRKICITINERLFHTQGDGGDNLKAVYKTEIGKIGGSICGEHTQLTLIYNWIMQGLQVHCSLWPGIAGVVETGDLLTRAVCHIGHVFGVLSATCIPEQNIPRNFYQNSYFNGPESIRGGSGVINPSGQYIAGPVYDEETIVYADIDLADIDKTRFYVKLTGLYSRWDLLNLNVSQETYQPLIPMDTPRKASSTSEPNQISDLEARVRQLEQQITSFCLGNTEDSAEKS